MYSSNADDVFNFTTSAFLHHSASVKCSGLIFEA